jgi:hypothetical protein
MSFLGGRGVTHASAQLGLNYTRIRPGGKDGICDHGGIQSAIDTSHIATDPLLLKIIGMRICAINSTASQKQ